jgi:proton-translocating NAD(P)+ transhydrogenase subunit alpha
MADTHRESHPMIAGITKESLTGERRVAVVPTGVPALTKLGLGVTVERGAGVQAGFPDADYEKQGASIVASRDEVVAGADLLLQVRTPGANPEFGRAESDVLRSGQVVVGLADPLGTPEAASVLASKGVVVFSLELVPRITRAQSMDVLSSQATVSGYKAVLIGASALPRLCPMMMTAAGTLAPARVFVIGAGVAGLQAIASARRLGAKVEAYDVRPAVKEQINSLGAKFVELPLDTAASEDTAGYAKAQDESFYRRQREMMLNVVGASDLVISTAAVPGKRAPVLITEEMVKAMAPGSVIVDLAAERGGNCELTKADETIVVHGVTIMGPTNLAATVPYHASQMYSRNIVTFVQHLVKGGQIVYDVNDEITRETLVTRNGEVVHARVRELLAA